MSGEKIDSALGEAEARRVEAGVWLRVVIAGIGASGIISVEDAHELGALLIATSLQPAPKKKGGG